MHKRFVHLFFATRSGAGESVSRVAGLAGFLSAFLLVALVFSYAFHQLQYQWGWETVYGYRQKFLNGWLVTVAISAASLILSLLIGLFFALAQKSSFLPLRYFSKIYIEAIRGTPLLVQILVFFYVVADAFGVGNRYAVGVLTLSLFAGAYICEIIRAGIESVGESQLESARAIGLTRLQMYRYVVFPQAFRRTLPPLAGQFASLVKDSSLLSIIAVSEFTLNAQEVNAFTYSTLESYLPLAVGYLILTFPISLLSRWLEKRFRYAS
ncbi:amino acid ABC transporter permease [Geomobilimonas luticola]|uniref:Amino acid ABC transporter permease n=1 Tax=Geomobilimonas luticola TaxID=1114878 RepID=A0ABS5SD16_9BACT|nr:amino acid ABC transporter permease [Geomobilimonas luticola]